VTTARIDVAATVPAGVQAVAEQLRAAGGRVWLVGGPVRDLLLGTPPRDFDLATDLLPAAVAAAVPSVDQSYARFGTCRLTAGEWPVVVTTLRAEMGHGDHRHPDAVRFVGDPAIDAERRDFTINGLYLDLQSGCVLDPVGGLPDLRARTLRAIGEPMRRFDEDALRLLRAVRFAARCECTIADATAAAIRARAGLAATLSAGRVLAELTSAFTEAGRGRALRLLVDCGLAAVLLPEVAAMAGVTQPPEYHPEGCVLTHVCLVLDHVPAGDPILAWSAVLHDVGKPPTWRRAADRIRFDGHDALSATMAGAILDRLHAPHDLRDAVVEICRDHIRFASLPAMRPRRRQTWMRSKHFARHLAFHRADCLGSHGKLDIWEAARRELEALPPIAEVLVTGKDALALDVPPGPRVGELLAAVHAAADESPTPMDRASALVLMRDMVARMRQDGLLPAR
jgi:poly(A) polymerase